MIVFGTTVIIINTHVYRYCLIACEHEMIYVYGYLNKCTNKIDVPLTNHIPTWGQINVMVMIECNKMQDDEYHLMSQPCLLTFATTECSTSRRRKRPWAHRCLQ